MEASRWGAPTACDSVLPFDNGAFGRCASYDSVFRLRDGETAGATRLTSRTALTLTTPSTSRSFFQDA